MPKNPEPDEFGRYRVQQDTGTKFSVQRTPLDGETVLDEPASDVAGDALPPEYPKSLSSKTPTSGQSAGSDKENANG
jgi:hypothetical protein